jgi:hypothetical protein
VIRARTKVARPKSLLLNMDSVLARKLLFSLCMPVCFQRSNWNIFKKTLCSGIVLMSAVLTAPAMAIPVIGSINISGGFATASGDLASATWSAISPGMVGCEH